MTRGTGKTNNKFVKTIGTETFVLEVGQAPHQVALEDLQGPIGEFTAAEVAQVKAFMDPDYEPPEEEKATKQEIADAVANAKAEWRAEEFSKQKQAAAEEKADKKEPKSELDEFLDIGGKDAPAPNAKRRPGRPRKVDTEARSAGTVPAAGPE